MTKGDKDSVVGEKVQRLLLLWTLVSEVIISLLFLGSLDTRRESTEQIKGVGLLVLAPTEVLLGVRIYNWSSQTVRQPDSHPSLVKWSYACARWWNDLIGHLSEL